MWGTNGWAASNSQVQLLVKVVPSFEWLQVQAFVDPIYPVSDESIAFQSTVTFSVLAADSYELYLYIAGGTEFCFEQHFLNQGTKAVSLRWMPPSSSI